jgi:hypothetical protein
MPGRPAQWIIERMSETEWDGDVVELEEPGDDELGDDELFDVHAWAEAYLADEEAQAEHARLAGVPFH